MAAYEKNTTYERVNTPEIQSLAKQYVGGAALIHFEANPPVHDVNRDATNFEHLFAVTSITPDLLTKTVTAEDAEQLLNTLEDGDPYKDYALSELALHFMQLGEIEHAYELLHCITENGRATYILSQLIIYAEDHDIKIIPLDKLGLELRELALRTYEAMPSTKNAQAVCEASEALPKDEELRAYARRAIAEHPEILPDV